MEAQRGKLLGDLYYNDEERRYVPPPIKERQALMQAKEEDYIKTVNEQNALDKFKRNLPKDRSPLIYNNILSKIDAGLQGITPENYSDKILDVEQLSNDVVNKFGGAELLEQEQKVQAQYALVDEAVKKGEIGDPNKAAWKKSQIASDELGYDKNGFVTKPVVRAPPIVPDQKISEKLETLIKDWESNGTYKRRADGSIWTSGGIPGYITYGKETSITEDEIRKAAMQVLDNDPKIKAWLEDEAKFQNRNVTPDAEGLARVLTQEQKDVLTGIPNSTQSDLEMLVEFGNVDTEGILNQATKHRIKQEQVEPYAQKAGFLKEEIVPLKDEVLMGYLATQRDIAKAQAAASAAKVPDTAVVTLEPFMTNRIVNPTDIDVIKNNKKVTQGKLVQKQTEINSYRKQLKDGVEGTDPERVIELNKELTALDNELATIDEQERGLRKLADSNFLKAGVNLDNLFKESYKEISKVTKQENSRDLYQLLSSDFGVKAGITPGSITGEVITKNPASIDVTDLIAKNPDIKSRLQSQGRLEEKNGRFEVSLNNLSSELTGVLSNELFDDNGTLSSKVKISDSSRALINKELKKTPTIEGFKDDIITLYNKNISSTNLVGLDKPFEAIGKHIIPLKVLQAVDKAREKQGEFNWELSTPLSYLAVTGESNKSYTKAYVNYENAERKSFIENKEQYSINEGGKLIKLGDYLRTKYGIPDLSDEYIDNDKIGFHTLVEGDRNYGQLYGTTIKLTAKGIEVAKDHNENVFNESNNIKVSLVNPNKRYNAQIRDQVLRSAPHLVNQNSEQSRDMLNQMGIVYANNSPEGQQLTNLNLYTMEANDKKIWSVRGDDYTISTWTRDANEPDDMNLDFTVSRIKGGVEEVQAINAKGETAWRPLKEIQDDASKAVQNGKDKKSEWTKIKYETPTDIMSMVGTTMLLDDLNKQDTGGVSTYNPFSAIMNSANYKQAVGGGVESVASKEVAQTVIKTEGVGVQNIQVYNYATQKPEVIASRVGTENLVNFADKYPGRVAQGERGVAYPLINAKAEAKLDMIMADFPVMITGGFRGDSSHGSLQFGAKNSMHKYAYSLDLGYDEAGKAFLAQLEADPSLANKYGLLLAQKHENPVHVHLEFNPALLQE